MENIIIGIGKTVEWETPQDLFNLLNEEFHFTIDVCATVDNTKCMRFYTRDDDGLSKDWSGERVWCNPPYGKEIPVWVEKACKEDCELVVMLLPARTDTRWFHEYLYGKCEIRFIKGRLKFNNAKVNAPFASMLCIIRKKP